MFRRQEVNVFEAGEIRSGADRNVDNGYGGDAAGGEGAGGGYAGYDPLDLSAAFGEDGVRGDAGDDEPLGKKRRIMAKIDVDRYVGCFS